MTTRLYGQHAFVGGLGWTDESIEEYQTSSKSRIRAVIAGWDGKSVKWIVIHRPDFSSHHHHRL